MPDRRPSASRWEMATLVAILAIALALRLDRIGWGLPSVYEEATPFKKAWDMWGFGPLGAFDTNPHWFQYPSLAFYLQFAGQAITMAALWAAGIVHSTLDVRALYFVDKTPFYVVGRSITAMFGAATVLPAWALARRAGGPPAAALAALLVAVHPGLVGKSQVIEVDVPLTFFVTLGLLQSAGLLDRPTLGAALRAGVVAGLAASTKYPGLVLLAPMLFAVWRARRAVTEPGPGAGGGGDRAVEATGGARSGRAGARRGRMGRREASPRARPAPGGAAGSPWIGRGAALVAACAVTLFATSPFLVLDPPEVSRDLAIGRQLMTLGHFGIAAGMAYRTYLHDWFASLLGWPLGLAALAGLGWALVRRRPWGLVTAALLVPYVAVVGSWQMKADRYLLPIVPAAAIGGAALLVELAAAVPWLRRPRAAGVAIGLGGLALAAPLAAQLPAHWASLRTDTRQLARRWIEAHLAPGSMVASELYGPDLLSPLDLQNGDDALLARLHAQGATARTYALQTIPMFVIQPERSDKFYRLAPYSIADAIVVTSSVRERYRGDPARYAAQVAFYDTLASRWPRVASFEPRGGPGPEIAIYRNPSSQPPYARRGAIPAVDTTLAADPRVSGGEAFFYFNLGLNAEWYGYAGQAMDAYLIALRFGGSEPSGYVQTSVRLASLLWREGRRGAALAMLRECRRRAPGPDQAADLAAAENAMLAGRVTSAPPGR